MADRRTPSGTKRGRKLDTTTRKLLVAEIQKLRVEGLADDVISDQLSEKYGLHYRTVRETYVARASKEALQRTIKHRPELLTRQTDRMEHAMRLALAHKEPKTVYEVQWSEREGKDGAKSRTPRSVRRTEWVPAPRLQAYLEANRELHRIHGLHAPERLEIVHIHVQQVLQVVVEAVRAEIGDDDQCRRIFERLQLVATQAEARGDVHLEGYRGKHRRAVSNLSPEEHE